LSIVFDAILTRRAVSGMLMYALSMISQLSSC
jgi:hypothetical protein